MSLRYALLGLLARECLTGYDLTKRFDSTVGFFWSAKHSQIYPELASLTADGLVTFELVTQTSKPNKKVYTLTEAGHEALKSWMSTPAEKRVVKDQLLMRIWVVGMVDPTAAIALLKDAREELCKKTDHLAESEAQALSGGADRPDADNAWLGAHMALRCGQLQHTAYCEWVEWSIELLERVVAMRETQPETVPQRGNRA